MVGKENYKQGQRLEEKKSQVTVGRKESVFWLLKGNERIWVLPNERKYFPSYK